MLYRCSNVCIFWEDWDVKITLKWRLHTVYKGFWQFRPCNEDCLFFAFRGSNPSGGKILSLLHTKLSVQWVRGFFPVVKLSGALSWTPPHLALRLRMNRAIRLFPPVPAWPVTLLSNTIPYPRGPCFVWRGMSDVMCLMCQLWGSKRGRKKVWQHLYAPFVFPLSYLLLSQWLWFRATSLSRLSTKCVEVFGGENCVVWRRKWFYFVYSVFYGWNRSHYVSYTEHFTI